ncbi:MAG: hypothetical protein ACI4DS_02325 [Eubacterium sp.]
MYNIFETQYGQPVILWHEKHELSLYSINNGKVSSHGTVCKDAATSPLIFTSRLNEIETYSFIYQTIKHTLSLNTFNNFNIESRNLCTLADIENPFQLIYYKEKYFLFFAAAENGHISVKCICSDSLLKSVLITEFSENDCAFSAFIIDDSIRFYSREGKNSHIYTLNSELLLQNDVSIYKQFFADYNELADYTGRLQEEVRRFRINSLKKENCLN